MRPHLPKRTIAPLESVLTLYAIFDPKPGAAAVPAAIPDQFSWLAALLPPIFALVYGLWLELLAFIALVLALRLGWDWLGEDAVVALYFLVAVAIGFAAPGRRRQALRRRGWRYRGEMVAPSMQLAQLEALR